MAHCVSIAWSLRSTPHLNLRGSSFNPGSSFAGVARKNTLVLKARKPLSQKAVNLRDLRDLDPQVLSEVHEQYFSQLYRYVRYRVPDHALAEDLTSETFVQLLDAIHSGKGPNSSIRGWLFGTAANLINSHFRRTYREGELIEERKIKLAPATQPNPIKRVEQQDLLSAAISKLTGDQQHVIALRFGTGMSIQETARVMDKNENAVKALQFRAIRSLRRELEETS